MQQKAAQTRTERKEASKGAAKAPARPCRPELEMIEAQQAIGNHGVLQTRLAVGAPGDRYEQEADRVAEAVLRMPEPRLQRQEEPEEEEVVQAQRVGGQITPLVQRQVEEEDEEEEQEAIRASSETGRTPVITPEMSAQIEALRGGGRPLPEPVRAFFEPRFGCDFSRVRIHAGRVAAESAGTLKARAFTIGTNVVFGSGQYAPEAPAGRRLLAHELAHVVQQKGPGLCNVVRRQTPSPEERRRAREGLSDRVLRHLDKALPYSGKRPLVAVIRPKGIEIRFRDGGKIYVDRSEKPLDAYLLKGQIEAHRAELKKREKWYMTVVRWLAPEPSVASLVEYTADWELSDRLFIVRRIAEGASLKSVLAELRSLSEANFKFIVVSASVIPFIAGMGVGAAAAKPPATAARLGPPAMGVALRVARSQAMRELARARARGGPVVVNIGGKGEVSGAINVNSNVTSVEIAPNWPNWVMARGEDLARIFPANSIDKVCSVKLWAGVNWRAIAFATKRVLKAGGKVSFNQLGSPVPIVEALRAEGFRDIKVLFKVLVEAVK